jgi:hypothetical protein
LWLTVCLATQSNKQLQQLRAWVNLLATAAPLLVTSNSQVHKAAWGWQWKTSMARAMQSCPGLCATTSPL